MEVDTNPTFDWANDAYLALNDMGLNSPSEKWSQFSDAPFTIPPSLISHASIERYGQITPPDELSPAAANNEPCQREPSIPVEQLRNEMSWPLDQKIQQLADYQPEQESSPSQSTPDSQDSQDVTTTRASKRRRTSKQSPSNQSSEDPATQQQTSTANPQQPKRKRGRPKSQPQTIETYTSDGFPVQVTSARQSHLEKNRVAAHKCRQRKKEYINSLEGRAREFSAKNKALKENVAVLREEVLELKNEVLRHAGCNFWAVDEYLARCAGDLLGMEGPSFTSSRQPSQAQTPNLAALSGLKTEQESNIDAATSQELGSPMSSMSHDDFDGLDFLNDDDEMDGND
jgi:hypothetical protein